ncbi:MAG: hypothetical protein AAFV29_12750, partial [Myxococcota bacterium]
RPSDRRLADRRPIAVGDLNILGLGTLSADRKKITKTIERLVAAKGIASVERVVQRAIRSAKKRRSQVSKRGDRNERRRWSEANVTLLRLNHAQQVLSTLERSKGVEVR